MDSEASSTAGAQPADEQLLRAEDGTPVGRLVVASLILVCAVYAVVEMRGFPPSGQLVPRPVGYGLLVLAVLNVVRDVAELRKWRLERRSGTKGDALSAMFEELAALGWVMGYAVGILVVGFTLASTVFMLVFLRIYGRESWRVTLTVTGVMMGLTYGIFYRFAGFGLYEGFLGDLFPL